MSEPSLADVIVRLDRLESALLQLLEVVRSSGRILPADAPRGAAASPSGAPPVVPVAPPAIAAFVSPPAGVPAGVAAPGEPPLINVAPVAPRGGTQPAASTGADPLAEPIRPYDPYAWRTDIDVPGPGATIQQVLRRVFEAGLTAEPEDTWAIMTKLTHPSQMIGPRALDHFKAFNWHKLRRTAPSYLQNGDPSTFIIAYTDPGEVTADVDRVRVFVKSGDNRMPVPVGFARDATNGNAWRLTLMSL